jgi:hypothetical protein
MDLLSQVISGAVVVLVGLVLNWSMRDKFRECYRYMDARFDGVDQRFDAVDQRFDRVDARLDRVEERVDALRSDVTQIALALGTRARPETG